MRQGLNNLGVKLELTPRNHHEGIGCAEAANDPTQRMAETSTRRAGLPLGFILDARMYAWHCRNLKCAAGRAHTRHEEHTGIRASALTSRDGPSHTYLVLSAWCFKTWRRVDPRVR